MLSCANSSRRPGRPQGYSSCHSPVRLKRFVASWATVDAIDTRTYLPMPAPITASRIDADRESPGVDHALYRPPWSDTSHGTDPLYYCRWRPDRDRRILAGFETARSGEGKESTRRGTTRVSNGLDLHRPGFPSPDSRPDTGPSPSLWSPTLRSS